MIGQLDIFSTELQIGTKKPDCSSCACGSWNCGGMYPNLPKVCEHWELDDCPVVKQRKPEDNPDRDLDPNDRDWMRSPCAGCMRALPDPGTHNYSGHWRDYVQHKYFCQYYKPSSCRSEPCLNGMMIQVWDNGRKWCALCEANGCEPCYKQWQQAQDILEELED